MVFLLRLFRGPFLRGVKNRSKYNTSHCRARGALRLTVFHSRVYSLSFILS